MIILFWSYSGEWIKNTLKLWKDYFPQISAFYNLQRYLDGLRLIIIFTVLQSNPSSKYCIYLVHERIPQEDVSF